MVAPDYRADIDGLRAVAVLLVVFCHFELGFDGGFVGVDVFFVISGYLITGIVRREMRSDSFSFRRFYARRARRILPALVAVCAFSLAAGWFLLLPSDLASLGAQVVSALAGVSNIYFALNTGYFDQSADLLPLLHTWSLGVEEQFYLLWPLALLLFHRRLKLPPLTAAWLAGGALLALLAMAQLIVAKYPDASFYLPFTRAWELALGAALTCAPSIADRRVAESAPVAGIAMIVAASLFYSEETEFPGLAAVLPCAGAALVLWPASRQSSAQMLLSLPPLVWVGRMSYSLYLWHWPVLVFARHYFHGGASPKPLGLVLLFFSIVASALSWKFIEQPFRRGAFRWRAPIGAVATVFLAGIGVYVAAGIPDRLSEEGRRIANFRDAAQNAPWDSCNVLVPKQCRGELGGRPRILLLGDSHARHFLSALVEEFPNAFFNVASHSGCRPVLQAAGAASCIAVMQQLYREVIPNTHFDAIIVSARWRNGQSEQVGESVEYLKRFTDRVIVFGQTLEYSAALPDLLLAGELLRAPVNLTAVQPRTPASRALNATIATAARSAGAEYYDPLEAICGHGLCRPTTPEGAPIQRDYGHLTGPGATYVLGRFRAAGLNL